jgi:PPOX class probable F420-dependent enzyme
MRLITAQVGTPDGAGTIMAANDHGRERSWPGRRNVPAMPKTATADRVDRAALEEFLRPRHKAVLVTRRSGGGVQLSPVTCGLDQEGRVVVSTYPQRAKVANARRDPAVSMCVLSEDFDGPWVQVDGTAEVLDLPEALEPLVDYYRAISGEHPDWDEYRAAMARQGKSLLRVTVERWGPIATGGFPPEVVDAL